MTREKQIYDAAAEYGCKDESAEVIDFVEGAMWADVHPHWISVEDELPENGQRVLISDKEDKIWAGVYVAHDDFGFCDIYTIHHDITHWMPMPPAPKKGGEE